MRKIICVTFPRSGHHLLTNALLKYYSKDLNFINTDGEKFNENQNVISAGNSFQYCEFYNHCKQIPCIDQNTNFQKNHDFGLKMDISDSQFYVILYRNPLESIVSLYKYALKSTYNNFLDCQFHFNREGWEYFAKYTIVYWKKFINKWVVGKNSANKLFLSYGELINYPMTSLINVIKFIKPEEEVDLKFLKLVVDKINFSKKNDIRDFEYYDRDFFAEIEREALDEIKSIGIDSKFN